MVVEIKKCEAGLTAQPDGRGTDVQLRPRVPVRPKVISRGHGPIRYRIHPVALAAWLKRDRPLSQVHPRHPSGRIVSLVVVARIIVLSEDGHHKKHQETCAD